jgi:hypothetical protein
MDKLLNELREATADQKVGYLVDYLEGHCGFSNVIAKSRSYLDAVEKPCLTIASILSWLFNSDSLILAESGIEFDQLPEQVGACRLIPTNIPNLFELLGDNQNSEGFIVIRSPSLGCEYINSYMYLWACDSLYLSLQISHISDWDGIVRDIFGHTGLLDTGSENKFMLDKVARSKAQSKISRRSTTVPFYHNGIDHLGHYFMNFLGPLSSHIASKVYNSQSILLISSLPSWFGDMEFTGILPRIEGFTAIQKNTILVHDWADAGRISELISAGLFHVQGSCISLSLSSATNQCLKELNNTIANFDPNSDISQLTIGIGLRGGTRSILNIIDLVETVTRKLVEEHAFNVNIVIDGMCSSRSLNENPTTQQLSLNVEAEQAREMDMRLAKIGISAVSTVGLPIMEQLAILSSCDFILTHSGSGSAKYLWALNKPTVVLNYPYHHNHMRYNSSDDPNYSGMTSLLFGRAFRGQRHADEWYLDKNLCVDAPGSQDHYRVNSCIDVENASIAIVDIIVNDLAS